MQPAATASLPHLNNDPQAIAFSESEGICNAEIISKTVVIGTDAGKHNHGSSKVKLKNIVDYNWEMRFYTGQLLAVHKGGDYLAYAMKVPNKSTSGAWSGMVRVIHKATDKRVLLKGMKGEIQDLEFAYIDNYIMLASIDELGHTYIHSIELADNDLRSSLLVEIVNDIDSPVGRHRVVWCPYIPDEDDDHSDDQADEDNARLLLTTHYNTARIWKMWGITNGLEAGETTVNVKSLVDGENPNLVTVSDHSGAIVDAAFSPDGTALATASVDGYVMFFQVYMQNERTPRCLHRWQPHDGKPLSCLFFLDNYKNHSSDIQFWKFAVTGADNNRVIKIWCCKSWECRQTITFAADIMSESIEPTGFKAVLDPGAEYLLLSDFKRRSLYVLHIKQETGNQMAYCKSVAEYLLPFPVLSFAIASSGSYEDPYLANGDTIEDGASPIMYDHIDDFSRGSPHLNGGDAADVCGQRTELQLYLLQPKGLQEGRLLYTPVCLAERRHSEQSDLATPEPVGSEPLDPLTNTFQQFKDMILMSRNSVGGLMGQRTESPPSAPPLNLMTPDAFSSPGKRDEDDPPIAITPDLPADQRVPARALSQSPAAYDLEQAPPKYASAGSSPSREVQEILSLKDGDYYKDDLLEPGATPETAVDGDQLENGPYEEIPEQDVVIANSKTIWPSITLAQINDANLRKASSDKSANHSVASLSNQDVSNADAATKERGVDVHQVVSQIVHKIEQLSLSSQDQVRLNAVEAKLEQITELMLEQNRQMRLLREELAVQPDPHEAVERALHAHTQQTALAIDQAFDQRWSRVEMAAAKAGASAADAVSGAMARVLDPLARNIQHEFATRMSTTDALLRDNIEKLVHSKSVQESLANAVARTLASTLRESFRDVIAASLIPTVEKAAAQIFRQVHQTFQAGTKEFASSTEAMARVAAERGAAAAVDSLKTQLSRHADTITSLASQPAQPTDVQQLTPVLNSAVKSVLEQEMARWREQAACVLERSRAQTPCTPRVANTPLVDRQRGHHRLSKMHPKCYTQIENSSGDFRYRKWKKMQVSQISSLLNAGDVNGAFQVALSASDLSLVVHACRKADPVRVFTPTCQLKQNVLLSLVQQLAADMTNDTQLKHRYLEEAIINLDASDPVTRGHLPVVVRELKRQLANFLSGNPTHPLRRQMKMLLMATESLLGSTM